MKRHIHLFILPVAIAFLGAILLHNDHDNSIFLTMIVVLFFQLVGYYGVKILYALYEAAYRRINPEDYKDEFDNPQEFHPLMGGAAMAALALCFALGQRWRYNDEIKTCIRSTQTYEEVCDCIEGLSESESSYDYE